jgi:hypothetical protein
MSSKWSLTELKEEYDKIGVDYNEVFKNIKALCVKTLMAVEPQITTAMRSTKFRNQCFEVYGFDVMIDHKLRPWLLEVNVCPSLSSSSPYDKQVKTLLLCDTLHLVGFKLYDRKRMEDDKKKENKHRLLGFESRTKPLKTNDKNEMDGNNDAQAQLGLTKNLSESPKKNKKELRSYGTGIYDSHEPASPDKYKIVKDKIIIPSFLDGFTALSEDDLEILAEFEEE